MGVGQIAGYALANSMRCGANRTWRQRPPIGDCGNHIIYGRAGDDQISGAHDKDTTNGAPGPTISFSIPPSRQSPTGLLHDADDRIIYETDTGKLFYDSNGIAAGGAVQIARLTPNLALTHLDFQVI